MPRTRHSTEVEEEELGPAEAPAIIGSGRGTIPQTHRTRGMFAEVPRRTETEATTRAFRNKTRLFRAPDLRGISY